MSNDEKKTTQKSFSDRYESIQDLILELEDNKKNRFLENGWKVELQKALESKEAHKCDKFVDTFSRLFKSGGLPEDAIEYLANSMIMKPELVAKILGVGFGKGEEKKPMAEKNPFQIALQVVYENNMSLSDVPDSVFDKVGEKFNKELETIKKYYSQEKPTFQKLQDNGVSLSTLFYRGWTLEWLDEKLGK